MIIDFFNYHINWKSRGIHPGNHKSDQRGMGIEFAGHSNLLDYPDPRRIDLRMTMKDPMDQVYVRIFNQRSASPVMIFSDLSSSMRFGNEHENKICKSSLIAQIIRNSAYRNSDAVGFVGFNNDIPQEWTSPLSYKPYRVDALIKEMKDYTPENKDSSAITKLHSLLPKDHTLIFIISDFHMPNEHIINFLSNTKKHTVIPIILWDEKEFKDLPRFGITTLTDPETFEEKTVLMRKRLAKKIAKMFENQKNNLTTIFNRFDAPPFFVTNKFNPDHMTQYFNEYYHA